jgi:hypothetical protein
MSTAPPGANNPCAGSKIGRSLLERPKTIAGNSIANASQNSIDPRALPLTLLTYPVTSRGCRLSTVSLVFSPARSLATVAV